MIDFEKLIAWKMISIQFLFFQIAEQREYVQKVTRDGDSGKRRSK